ncbi:protein of unknown function DUF1778 [Cyanobacterium stanieri PCC 7202]|uniref:Uncharacterized protein n=1 Tax=Cyanobacterium stanieri (strain ATCC 29140 / PCC 7202) TaxID=292563 RepID=K9YM37_CYASC|nr:protein of unknown function DUF1778 [Cyanobacterium stanieri PCC 7202]
MTLTELLPKLHYLSQSEKLMVIKFLVQELESELENLTSSESIFLSSSDWQKITTLICNPPSPTQSLLSAIERYSKEVTS